MKLVSREKGRRRFADGGRRRKIGSRSAYDGNASRSTPHLGEARPRQQQREAARAEKLRRARSDPFPRAHDDDIETHDMTEDDETARAGAAGVVARGPFRASSKRVDGAEAESSPMCVGSRRWRRSAQPTAAGGGPSRRTTRGASTSAWRTEPEEEDPEEAARRAHAEAGRGRASEIRRRASEAERLYAKAQQQMDAARDHRKKQTEAAAKKPARRPAARTTCSDKVTGWQAAAG